MYHLTVILWPKKIHRRTVKDDLRSKRTDTMDKLLMMVHGDRCCGVVVIILLFLRMEGWHETVFQIYFADFQPNYNRLGQKRRPISNQSSMHIAGW